MSVKTCIYCRERKRRSPQQTAWPGLLSWHLHASPTGWHLWLSPPSLGSAIAALSQKGRIRCQAAGMQLRQHACTSGKPPHTPNHLPTFRHSRHPRPPHGVKEKAALPIFPPNSSGRWGHWWNVLRKEMDGWINHVSSLRKPWQPGSRPNNQRPSIQYLLITLLP